jgi:hypothetical protein
MFQHWINAESFLVAHLCVNTLLATKVTLITDGILFGTLWVKCYDRKHWASNVSACCRLRRYKIIHFYTSHFFSRAYDFLLTHTNPLNTFWLAKWKVRVFESFRNTREQTVKIVLKLEFRLVSIFTVGFCALLLDVPVRPARRKWNLLQFAVWCQQVDGNICARLKLTVKTEIWCSFYRRSLSRALTV